MKKLFIVFQLVWIVSVQLMASKADSLKLLLEQAPSEEKSTLLNQIGKIYLSLNLDSATAYSQNAGFLAQKHGQTEQLAFSKKHLAIINYYRRDFNKAMAYNMDAKQLFQETGNELEYSNILSNMALIELERGMVDEAIALNLESLAIKEKLNNPESIIITLTNLGNCYLDKGDYENASTFFARGIQINDLIAPDKPNQSLTLGLGSTLFATGKYFEALDLYNEHIKLAQSNNDPYSLISLLNNRGNVLLRLGEIGTAIADFERAIEQFEQVSRKNQLPSLLLNLGNVYYQNKRTDEARDYYLLAFHEASALNQNQVRIRSMMNLSLAYGTLNQSDSALFYIESALNDNFTTSNTELFTMATNLYGSLLVDLDDLKRAEPALVQAYQSAKENQIVNEQVKAAINLGSLYYELKQYRKADEYYTVGLNLSKQIGDLSLQSKSLLGLSEIAEAINSFQAGLNYFKEYKVIYDSIYNIEKQEQVSKAEGRLNLKLKEEQLENQRLTLEQKENALSVQRTRTIYIGLIAVLSLVVLVVLYNQRRIRHSRNQLKLEQEKLEIEQRLLRAQMNPHFMFNALNSIQAFISDNNTMQAELYLSKFARLMRYYLDSSFKNSVSLQEEITGLQNNIELEQLRLDHSFSFELIVDDSIEPEDVEVPPMLIQPFVENAIKHGLRSRGVGGVLKVHYQMINDETMKCTVEDNGVGRDVTTKMKLIKSGHASRGIEITRSRLRQIWNSHYKSEYFRITDLKNANNTPVGTRVEILFPVKY